MQEKKVEKLNIIAGLSGGPDSVLLLELLLLVQKDLTNRITIAAAAHLNHGWRDNAHDDELLCKNVCANHCLPLEVGHGADIITNRSHKGSREDEGRHKRRLFFEQCRKKYKADLIALGHHQDDQLETFFIRLTRGTSLSGLGCMKPWSDPYIRPLLSLRKKTILGLCASHKLLFTHDKSNEDPAFLRNRVRHELLPVLDHIDDRFTNNIIRTIDQLQQDQELLEIVTETVFNIVFYNDESEYEGKQKEFIDQPARMQQRLIMMWLIKSGVPFTPSRGHINEILFFLKNPQGGRHLLHQCWCIEKKQQRFKILRFS